MRVRTGGKVIFSGHFLERCFLEEKNLDSFAEEYPFSLRGRVTERRGEKQREIE